MKLYDLSPEINESMAVYKNKGEKRPKIKITRTLKQGSNESRLDIESHTGSHADAPYHFLANGKTIEKVPLEKFFGKCTVLDFTSVKYKIGEFHLRNSKIKIEKNDIVLLKSKILLGKIFDFHFTYLDKTGAKFLASKKIKAVGTDALGIERDQKNHETHKILLQKGIIIFEGLDLSKVKEGKYLFYGFPLKIKQGDASPIRAVLVEN